MTALPAPFLTREEVLCGHALGKGAFCKVSSVKLIVLKEILRTDEQEVSLRPEAAEAEAEAEGRPSSPPPSSGTSRFFSRVTPDLASQEEARRQLASRDQSSFPLLAIKELHNAASSVARKDLHTELGILRKMRAEGNHPHVVELFAVGVASFDEEDAEPTFLVLGRLRATLSNVLHSWRERRGVGLFQYLGIGVRQFRDLWLERLHVLSKIASAIEFLHSHRIVYRDLKPDNVGFDADDVPKLFDFGLGKVIDERDYDEIKDAYKLTGVTGSLRYMAPEVAKERPYGMSVDVYGLSILMHQVLSLKVPFVGIPPSQFRQQVFGQGVRLPMDPAWPKPLQRLLQTMWDENPKSRPKSRNVYRALENMLRGEDADLFPSNLAI